MKAILIFVLAVLFATPAWSCSCIGTNAPQKEQIATAYQQDALIFLGRVVSVEPVVFTDTIPMTRFAAVRYTFAVSRYFKGQTREATVVVETSVSGSACGKTFVIGSEQLLYASSVDWEVTSQGQERPVTPYYVTSLCHRTKKRQEASRAELRQLKQLAKHGW